MTTSNLPSLKQPTAFVPIAMSVAALIMVLGFLARYGAVHEADEGAAAHTFQLLLVLQLPIVAFFAVKWLPRAPKAALRILALQAAAGLAALAPVYLAGL